MDNEILGSAHLSGFTVDDESGGEAMPVAAEDAAFQEALRITASPEADATAAVPVPVALAEGDVFLVRFSVRSSAGAATPEVRFEPGLSRWAPPLRMAAPAGSEWREYEYPFKIRRAYDPEEATLGFLVPAGGTVEVGGLQLLHHGQSKAVGELPCTRLDYEGGEPDAAWRTAAAERIEKIRKAGLSVNVTDDSGQAVEGAQVAVRMKKHAFGFGTVVNVRAFHNLRGRYTAEDVERYRSEIVRLSNRVVFESATKWPAWEEPERQAKTIETIDWLLGKGIEVRGHVLIWPSWRWLPERLKEFENDPAALRRESLEHIRDEASTLSGKICEWDVMNEPFANHDLMDIIGDEIMIEWWQAARKADPHGKLYINDYDILANDKSEHLDHYEKTIAYLIENGAPLDGIGLQGHFGSQVTPPEELLRRLDRFAKFGKELQITEFDVETVDLQLQAGYTRDVMTVLFSHPSATGFIMWGFWENRHWKPNAAMYWSDWTPKPNAQAYDELVFKTWWTNESGQTGPGGQYTVRGFHGDYEIEVKHGGTTRTIDAVLPAGGTVVNVRL